MRLAKKQTELILPKICRREAGAVRKLQDACSQDGPGFFYLKMDQQEASAAAELLRLSREFFALDAKRKNALRNSSDHFFRYRGFRIPASGPGYRPVAGDANFQNDSRESFNVGRSDLADDPNRPYGSTPWPQHVPGFREACENYASLLCRCSCELRKQLAEALGMSRDYFEAPGLFDTSPWLLGMVHYMPTPSDVAKGCFGIAPHQDDGIFTLLHTDGTPGLQICPSWQGSVFHRDEEMLDPSLEWVDVDPIPGHWIVNLGTQLTRWSRGRFKATLHRVIVDSARPAHRYSLPFFYEANLDAPLTMLGSSDFENTLTPGEILLEMAQRDGLELLRDTEV